MKSRQEYIGSADICAVVGLSPFSTALEVYNAKVHGKQIEESEAMKWGLILESPILGELARSRNLIYEGFQVFASELEFLGGTADALTDDAVVEIKTTNAFNGKAWEDKIPEHVEVQCQYLMGLHKKQKAYVGALIGGQTFRDYVLDFNPRIYHVLREAAIKFWEQHVVPQIPPAHSSRDERQVLFTAKNGIEVGDGIADSLLEIQKLRHQVDLMQDLIKKFQDEIYEKIGDAEFLMRNGTMVGRRLRVEREMLDKKKVQEALGEKFNECLKKSVSYQLRII